jgi:hypothetical protein
MEIQALRVQLREDELNEHLPRVLPPDAAVQNLRVRLTPEGVVVQGDYPTFMVKMAFETLWELTVANGAVQARLASVKVAGLPATLLRGVLLKVIRDVTAQHPGLSVQDESVFVEVGPLLQAKKISVTIHLTGVRCSAGQVVIEAGDTTVASAQME